MVRHVRIFIVALIVSLMIAAVAFAADFRFVTLLSNATAPVVGNAVDMTSTGIMFKHYSCEVEVSDNSTTAVVVAIDGNQSCGVRYSTMVLHPLTWSDKVNYLGSFSIEGMAARCIRARLITLEGGVNPAVSVRCTGVK
jgi:hypothetical protein